MNVNLEDLLKLLCVGRSVEWRQFESKAEIPDSYPVTGT